MGCISSKHTGLSSKEGRHSRASVLPIVNSFLKIDKKELLLQDDQRKKLLLQDGQHKVSQQDAQSEKPDQDEQGSLHQTLHEEPEVVNVWELMEGLEDDSSVSSNWVEVESSESRNRGSRESSPSLQACKQLICVASTAPVAADTSTANTDGSARSPLCFDSRVKRRFRTANGSTLETLATNRNFSFKLMYLGDQASTPKLILDSTSPLLQAEQLRDRLILSRESNAVTPRGRDVGSPAHGDHLESHDEEDLLCTFENMLEQLSSDDWLSRRASDAESFDPESPVSVSTVKKQQDEESWTTLYFTRDDAQQNEYNAIKSILRNYGITVNEKEINSNTRAPIDSSIPVPALFIKGRYIGGAEQLLELDKDGQLGLLLNHKTAVIKDEHCQGCGGLRSVPCLDCNGSLRFVAEDGKLEACTGCSNNGVVRCPLCS